MLVDKEAIRTLADILTETGLTEIEIAEAESRIRVVRTVTMQAAPASGPVVAVSTSGGAMPASGDVVEAVTAHETGKKDDLSSHPGIVSSPMVGVAYLTPDPASPPFAEEGSQVTAGQTIMLIEAMKTFNQIKAPRSGKLVQYCISSGEPVEFGAPLAIIE